MFNRCVPHTITLRENTKHKLAKAVMAKYDRGWECIKGIQLVTNEKAQFTKNGRKYYVGNELYTAVMRRRAI